MDKRRKKSKANERQGKVKGGKDEEVNEQVEKGCSCPMRR